MEKETTIEETGAKETTEEMVDVAEAFGGETVLDYTEADVAVEHFKLVNRIRAYVAQKQKSDLTFKAMKYDDAVKYVLASKTARVEFEKQSAVYGFIAPVVVRLLKMRREGFPIKDQLEGYAKVHPQITEMMMFRLTREGLTLE